MKQTNTKTTTATTSQDFTIVLREYENAVANNTADYTEKLQTLATACVFSVLKKLYNVSTSPKIASLRSTTARDLHELENLRNCNNSAYQTRFDKDGNTTTEIIDKSAHNAVCELIEKSLGEGIDLIQESIVAILEETNKAKERGIQANFLEVPYTIRRLKRKVYIQFEDSAKGWEEVQTTAIQEIYKHIRRVIENSRTIQTNSANGYTYIEDFATNEETDAETVIYRRFGKYADIGGFVTDFNGKQTEYTADIQTAKDIDEIITSLNLTARQTKVLQLRLSGYGYKAIATYLGIKPDKVQRTVKAIQDKATIYGLNPIK